MADRLTPKDYIQPYEYVETSADYFPEVFSEHVLARRDGLLADQVTTLTIVQPNQHTDVDILTNRSDVVCVTVVDGLGDLVVREYHEGEVRLTRYALKPGDQLGVGPEIQFYFEAEDEGLVVRDMRLLEPDPKTTTR